MARARTPIAEGPHFAVWRLHPATRQRCYCGRPAEVVRRIPTQDGSRLWCAYCAAHWERWMSLALASGMTWEWLEDAVDGTDWPGGRARQRWRGSREPPQTEQV